jgi:hypothetical protein
MPEISVFFLALYFKEMFLAHKVLGDNFFFYKHFILKKIKIKQSVCKAHAKKHFSIFYGILARPSFVCREFDFVGLK